MNLKNSTNVTYAQLLNLTTPPTWMRFMAAIIGIPVCVGGGLLNLTTLLAFARDLLQHRGRHLWLRHYINIAGLALTDAVLCIFCCSQFVLKYATGHWPFSAFYCRIFWSITGWSIAGGVNMLVLVGNDRYRIVKYGARYETKETWQKVKLRTVLFGLVQSLLAVPGFFTNYLTGVSINKTSQECYPELFQMGLWFPILSMLVFLNTLVLMIFFYVRVYLYMRKAHVAKATSVGGSTPGQLPSEAQQTASSSTTPLTAVEQVTTITVGSANKLISPPLENNNIILPSTAATPAVTAAQQQGAVRGKMHKRAAGGRILKYLVIALFVCDMPYFIVAFTTTLVMSGRYPSMDANWWIQLYDLMQVVAWINNAVDPLLYGYTMPRLHVAMVGVWRDAAMWCVRVLGCRPLTKNNNNNNSMNKTATPAPLMVKTKKKSIKTVGVMKTVQYCL